MRRPDVLVREALRGYSDLPFPMSAYAGLIAIYNAGIAVGLLTSGGGVRRSASGTRSSSASRRTA